MNIEPHEKFRRREEWLQNGKDFLVLVRRHEEKQSEEPACYDSPGPQRWCVYAYIYPKHPLFAKIDAQKRTMQECLQALPLHAYPSYFRVHRLDDGSEICSYEVGADYNHLQDGPYTRMETPKEAWTVFGDAQELFDVLQAMAEDVANVALAQATSGE